MSTESLRSTRRVSSLFLDRFHAHLRGFTHTYGVSRTLTGLSRSAKRIHSGLNEGFIARLCGVYSQHPALFLRSRGGQFRFTSAPILPNMEEGWKFTSLSYCSFSAQPHITDSHISWTPKLSVGGSLISKSVLTKRVLMTLPCLW